MSRHVKLLALFGGLSAVQATVPWELSTTECRQIQKLRPKSIIIQCPMLSMIDRKADESVADHCRRAGCCHTKHRGNDICWLNGSTYKAQRQTRANMRLREQTRVEQMSQLDLIKEQQKKQQELAILALEEMELKREEEQLQQEEQELINEELERQRLAMEERQRYLESEEENSDEDGEHRAFQLIHFGAGVEATQKQQTQKQRQIDESRCLQGIARERAIKGSTCVANVDFTARVSCDVQETLNRNPDMSLCSACVRSGCCFDATPRIINGYRVFRILWPIMTTDASGQGFGYS